MLALVKTWDGGKPEVNRQLEVESMTSGYKDGWYNDYEQAIDQGRVSYHLSYHSHLFTGLVAPHYLTNTDSLSAEKGEEKEI